MNADADATRAGAGAVAEPARHAGGDAWADRSRVYVVVLNWNGSSDTEQCVRSLLALNHPNYCILVCDNQSQPADLAATRGWGSGLPGGLQELCADQWPVHPGATTLAHRQVLLLHTGGNLGFAGGVNVGLRFARAQPDMAFAWILNNDTTVDADALQALVDRATTDSRIGICGSTLIYNHNRDIIQALGGARYNRWRARSAAVGAFEPASGIPDDPSSVERSLAYVNGASMLVSKDFLDSVGPMEESYFLYSEEHDWAQRGVQLGYQLAYAPKSMVFHKHGASIGTSASGGSALSLYYLYRNKALFAARHHRETLAVSLLSLTWEGLKFLLKGQPAKSRWVIAGLVDFAKGKVGKSFPNRAT